MRILCLHGTALNGKVFENMTAKLRSALPQHYSYEWLDGQHDVEPPTMIRDAHPGPYLSHIESLTVEGTMKAITRLETVMDERGPFDGVLGFSEGAMIAASLLFKNQIDTQLSTLRFGIFVSGFLPLTWTNTFGSDYYQVMRKYPQLFEGWQQADKGAALCQTRINQLMLDQGSSENSTQHAEPRDESASRLRCLHPAMNFERLNICTAHIWGRQDVVSKQSQLLMQLCDPDRSASFQHDGGHEIPLRLPDIKAVGGLIQNAILESEFAL
ncbi:hypothetical protein HIM_01832 [Hirsutella minnesotensis 3608]|nr:hypothetical protein HIM_01832 [Hirsutella minnesotensis 3608]